MSDLVGFRDLLKGENVGGGQHLCCRVSLIPLVMRTSPEAGGSFFSVSPSRCWSFGYFEVVDRW